jgi:hypothetical protein
VGAEKKWLIKPRPAIRLSNEQLDHFMGFVMPCPPAGCWLWVGKLDMDGYGLICFGKLYHRYPSSGAHVASYRHFVGDIPENREVHHNCFVRCCVNPDHLEAVTKSHNKQQHPPRHMKYRFISSENRMPLSF